MPLLAVVWYNICGQELSSSRAGGGMCGPEWNDKKRNEKRNSGTVHGVIVNMNSVNMNSFRTVDSVDRWTVFAK